MHYDSEGNFQRRFLKMSGVTDSCWRKSKLSRLHTDFLNSRQLVPSGSLVQASSAPCARSLGGVPGLILRVASQALCKALLSTWVWRWTARLPGPVPRALRSAADLLGAGWLLRGWAGGLQALSFTGRKSFFGWGQTRGLCFQQQCQQS